MFIWQCEMLAENSYTNTSDHGGHLWLSHKIVTDKLLLKGENVASSQSGSNTGLEFWIFKLVVNVLTMYIIYSTVCGIFHWSFICFLIIVFITICGIIIMCGQPASWCSLMLTNNKSIELSTGVYWFLVIITGTNRAVFCWVLKVIMTGN